MTEFALRQIETSLQRGDLSRCMRLCREGLKTVTRGGSPYAWAVIHSRLAQCHLSRSGGQIAEDVEASIHHFQLALQEFRRRGHAVEWARCHDLLGLTFCLRQQGDRAANIETAIAHYEKALEVWTRRRAPEIWAGIQGGLAVAFRSRVRGNRAQNLQQAVQHYADALEVWTRQADPAHWARTHLDLADLHRENRQDMPGQPLDAAIRHYELALQVLSQERTPAEWGHIHRSLGECYGERLQGGRDRNLEASIAHYEQALLIYDRQTHPEEWASTMSDLGVSYQHRVGGSRADNLQRAIHCFQQALQVYTRDKHPVAWSKTQTNLANAYLGSTGLRQADDTEAAIKHLRAALEVTDAASQPVLWATIQYNLGNAYSERRWWDMGRYLQGKAGLELKAQQRERDVETAIEHYHSTLQVFTPRQMAQDWAMVQNSLGRAYIERIRGNRAENVEEAIQHLNQALTVRTRQHAPDLWAATQHNLGVACEARVAGNRKENLREAEQHYRQALRVFDPDRFPVQARESLLNLAGLHFARGQWKAAVEAYERAAATLGDPQAVLHSVRARAFEIEATASLYPNKAYCLLKLGQPVAAFNALEQGRARLLHDALPSHQDTQEALARNRLPDDVLKSIKLAFQTPGSAPAATLTILGPAFHSASRYYQTYGDGSELSDFVIHADEEEEPEPHEEPIAIPDGCALIAPLVTERGGAVFIVTGELSDLKMGSVLWMDRLTDQTLRPLVAAWMRAYPDGEQAESETEQERAQEEWQTTVTKAGGALWGLLIGPVHEHLRRRGVGRLILLPQSRLQLLPLHAAWRVEGGERRYLLDDYEISYAPSARMQMLCQKRLQTPHASGSLVVGVDSYQQLPRLSYAGAEAQMVATILEATPLVDNLARKEAVLAEMSGKGYLHFACHGRYGWQGQPLASALYVAEDVSISLYELVASRDLAGTRLVTLSACQSGLAALTASPDEYVGLPAGFLLLGAAGILSSLWLVDDRSTYLLMERFYQNHVLQKLPPAQALREAQRWLRAATRQELADYFKSKIRMGPGKAAVAYIAYMTMVMGGDPLDRPYAHPFYWATFAFTGA